MGMILLKGNRLSDMERKILTIIQHNYREGKFINIQEVEFRSSYEEDEITGEMQRLIVEGWIKEHDGIWRYFKILRIQNPPPCGDQSLQPCNMIKSIDFVRYFNIRSRLGNIAKSFKRKKIASLFSADG